MPIHESNYIFNLREKTSIGNTDSLNRTFALKVHSRDNLKNRTGCHYITPIVKF